MAPTDPIVGRAAREELKIFYPDDPDPEKAGQGLAFAPLVFRTLESDRLNYWMMSPSEQMAMIYLMEHVRPRVAIEIGTRFGGSLQVLSRHCERVYSLDIDPEVPERLAGRHANVEYLIGPSDRTLPTLVARLQEEGAEVGFVLVDGDHSADGVRKDIDNLLRFKPVVPMYIVMHDSFNPECRRGLREADWAGCPYVHAVELDLVAGCVNPAPAFGDEPWGGLALGVLRPEPRQGRFEITGRAEQTLQYALEFERSRDRRSLPRRVLNRLRRMVSPGPGGR
jgi:Cephalosporin hydroxylase